jgi:hypothetical protein
MERLVSGVEQLDPRVLELEPPHAIRGARDEPLQLGIGEIADKAR